MSEEGWRRFLGAEGVDDWVVMYGGATAVFVTGSLADSAALASAVAGVAGVDGSGALLTLTDRRVSVRLNRGVERLEAHHVDLARRISAVAVERGAVADPGAVQEVQVAVAARPGEHAFGFWRAVLGYDELAEDNAVDPLGHGSTFWRQDLDPDKPLRHAMHVDVCVPLAEAESRLASALAAGGRVVDDSAAPAYRILADPAGNKVCIACWPDGGAWGEVPSEGHTPSGVR